MIRNFSWKFFDHNLWKEILPFFIHKNSIHFFQSWSQLIIRPKYSCWHELIARTRIELPEGSLAREAAWIVLNLQNRTHTLQGRGGCCIYSLESRQHPNMSLTNSNQLGKLSTSNLVRKAPYSTWLPRNLLGKGKHNYSKVNGN